ncbi:MAG: CotH kinase family protein [Candidatus Cloacimonadales bacterium]|nr:CotH kinase family protein [Candidatus Cloacimonadales bacterium]
MHFEVAKPCAGFNPPQGSLNNSIGEEMKFYQTVFLLLFATMLMSQSVVLNEAMSSNAITIHDEDGDTPDWIELYNASGTSINLNNYGISDDFADPFKWTFPNTPMAEDEKLLLFASGKNRRFSHLETIIDWGAEWKYFLGFAEPPADWRETDFDDSNWFSGPSGIGLGDGDDATVIPMVISYFMRHTFTITDTSTIVYGLLHVDYDDAFVAYLNGTEIARANIGTPGNIPAYNDFADQSKEAQIYQGGLPEQFLILDMKSLLVNGNNVLCIQTHNESANSNDLTMIPFLTLAMTEIPENPVGLAEILASFRPLQHTNFKISSSGETLYLVDESGSMLDSLVMGEIPVDVSIGLQPDGGEDIFYFKESTPGAANTTNGYQNLAAPPVFNIEGGFYTGSVSISLSGNQTGEAIHYTIDGTKPSNSTFMYTNPISIDSTTVIRARILGPNSISSQVITNTYFFNVNHTLPIISLATTPANFFDWNTGIYVMGPNATLTYPYLGANFWQDWEKPVHVEIFTLDGTRDYAFDAGTKIIGRWSRGKPQKSLGIFARSSYGFSSIDYQLFEDKPIDQFESFLLRNSGGDWQYTHCRDAVMTTIMEHENLDYQEYKPVIVYLNGQYWGLYNMREKVSEHFLASNNPGVDPDNIDFLENDAVVHVGDSLDYHQLKVYIQNHDLTIPDNYAYVSSRMDIENFTKYLATNIYYDNGDWPRNNVSFWRERLPEAKWKWILDDMDWGFSFSGSHNWDNNTFDDVLTVSSANLNPAWSTFLIRRLMTNLEFRNGLINCIADYMNTIFQPDNVISVIDGIYDAMYPEWQRHVDRWADDSLFVFSMETWNAQMDLMRQFAVQRHIWMPQHIMNTFNLPDSAEVTLNVSNPAQGKIKLNFLNIEEYPWSGLYYEDIPVILKAIPKPGYHFVEWTGDIASSEDSISVSLAGSMNIEAVFAEESVLPGVIVINEINYNSSQSFNPEDWVEIYNFSDTNTDLSNWILKDDNDQNEFTLPEGLIILADSFYVLCRDSLAFHALFPEVENYLGNWDFGLNGNSDMVRIFDAEGNLVDAVLYHDESPWPPEPDGNGPTLSLRNPGMNNQLPQSWAASGLYGTPGMINDVYVSANEQIPGIPDKLLLYPNFPNPFNPVTTIKYSLPADAKVVLRIFNLKGQLTKVMIDAFQAKGEHSITWDGTDTNGKSVASGLYFYQLVSDKKQVSRKMLLLK